MTSQRPIYRYAPRSHVHNCPCRRCVQVRSRPSPGGDLIAFDMGCLGVIVVFWVIAGICAGVAAAFRWAVHNHVAVLETVPFIVAGALIIWAVVYFNRRELQRPPKGRLRVEATVPPAGPPPGPGRPFSSAPHPPQRPLCQHFNAEPVNLPTGERVGWACPDCPERLPLSFIRPRRRCCGTSHEEPHWGNCVHA